MKRRFFALLAVPALALGFALASPTDQAQAYIQLDPDTVSRDREVADQNRPRWGK